MATPTYVLIDSVDTSGVNTITFSSIPSTYRDLVLVCNFYGDANYQSYKMTFNNNTSGYSLVLAYGDGSSTLSGTRSGSQINLADRSNASGRWWMSHTQIMDYSQTNKDTSGLTRSNIANGAFPVTEMNCWRWDNTSVVNEIDISISQGTNFGSGSKAFLYGIEA